MRGAGAPRTEPYGTWASPITAALAAEVDGAPDFLGAVGDEVWWTEPRPAEGGRRALVRLRPAGGGPARTVLPAPWNVRSGYTEYGGLPWAAAAREAGPLLVFAHHGDQRLYAWEPDRPEAGPPRPLTPEHGPTGPGGRPSRYVEPVLRARPDGGHEVWCAREEFTGPGPGDVRRALVAVPVDGSAAGDPGAVTELTDDRWRFTTGPVPSADGSRLARLVWEHPDMPWDATRVLVSTVDPVTGRPGRERPVPGPARESVAQALWCADGSLALLGDRSGWWNPVFVDVSGGAADRTPCGRPEEFGGPLWQPGRRWAAALADGTLAVLHGVGRSVPGLLDPVTGDLADAAGPWTHWAPTLAVSGPRVYGVAAGPRSAPEVVEWDTASGHARALTGGPDRSADGPANGPADRSAGGPVDPVWFPEPQRRVFRGPAGREVHALLYPPHHPARRAPAGEAPPLVVWAHGGPTDHVAPVLDVDVAYFTSRGFAVVEVNYGGSTGYGRAYRERLREGWGVVDVEDCAAVARALAAEGTVDPARVAIRGGSAGGWTAAAALASGDGVFACGTLRYPVLDLEGFAAQTHDLESRYPEGLVGPGPVSAARSRERSPVARADRVTAPFLLLQGSLDAVCPPAQARRFLAAMAGRSVPHAYLEFPGEGHGFRRAETLTRALEAELALYTRVFALERPTDDPPPLEWRD
ncbi:alpha/beta hydrolase family protein [Streptomyces sp. BI20]|uniref:S9 family peptidase n=1 Tax=Streptomyces sp. BI20 TaxID=3403460 RepID=UPI003C709CC3